MPKDVSNALPYPMTGEIYTFRTPPATEFSVPETGRYAALKILHADSKLFVVATLKGIWPSPPLLTDLYAAEILVGRYYWQNDLACWGVWADDGWRPYNIPEITLLGCAPLSKSELDLADQYVHLRVGSRHGSMEFAAETAEHDWRWNHDREVFTDEIERVRAKYLAIEEAKELRYRNRLKNLTWDQLLSETPLERWVNSPPYPDAAFTAEARNQIRLAQTALRDLGPKPKKAEVRAILRACVNWFNAADKQAGGAIETDEREDICDLLEEMAYVARQKSLVDEVDDWRTW